MVKKRIMDHDAIVAVFFILFAIVIGWQSLELGLGSPNEPASGFFPFLTLFALGILSLAYLIFKICGRFQGTLVLNFGPQWPKAFYVTIITFIYVAVFLNILGYLISTFLWLCILFLLGGMQSWKKNIIIAITITIFSYLLLVKGMKASLPDGIF